MRREGKGGGVTSSWAREDGALRRHSALATGACEMVKAHMPMRRSRDLFGVRSCRSFDKEKDKSIERSLSRDG